MVQLVLKSAFKVLKINRLIDETESNRFVKVAFERLPKINMPVMLK